MKTAICQTDELLDIIIDLQERGFDHDFIIDHDHIRCIQYNEMIWPDDFDIVEIRNCSDKIHLNHNYTFYAIALKGYPIKGILMNNHKSDTYDMSLQLWQKFNNGIVRDFYINRLMSLA